MKGAGAAVKVGATVVIVAILTWFGFKFVGKGLKSESGYPAWALFHDATGLVEKSRVQIAGLVIGELKGRELYYDPSTKTTLAKVSLRIKPDIVVWSNAAIYKRSSSLLGEFYLEIDPGTPESPDPVTGKAVANYPLKGCAEATGNPDCERIKNVVEAITTTDVLVQVNETLPVLRDILRDVHTLTQGPLQDIAREVQHGVKANSDAAERLLEHVDEIAQDLRGVTNPNGAAYQDLRESLRNVRDITESIKTVVGTGEGHVNGAAEKVKRDLDKISNSLDKLDHTIDQVSGVVEHVSEGKGTVGKLLKDDVVARDVSDIVEDTSNFTRTLFRLQTILGVEEDYYVRSNAWKTTVSLRLMPRPDKYYLLEFVDDPRGTFAYEHRLDVVSGAPGSQQATVNTDTWIRTSAFRFTFQFAKRIQYRGWGFTGLVGIKESTGGFGGVIDAWHDRFRLNIDLFDFTTATYPRLRIQAALEVFRYFWLIAGLDDIINVNNSQGPPGITCGPATPQSWCQNHFDYFFGARLMFTDDDLRALLTIGGASLLSSAGTRGPGR